jgi:serine/threonine protein kinase
LIEKSKLNNNLHSKYQRPAKSWTRKHSLNLNCLNRTTIKDYDIVCMIGQGAFGIVQRATKKDTGEKVAIKQYERSKLEKEPERAHSLRKEMNILSKLDHVGIMKFVDSIDTGHRVNLVLEYINGNNLYQYIRKMPESRIRDEQEVKTIFKQILESVSYMHEQRVVHRDLKLENILIDRKTKQTKLIDFGFATTVSSISDTKLPFSCGTPIYMCPEMA